jgi:hypothetical protein
MSGLIGSALSSVVRGGLIKEIVKQTGNVIGRGLKSGGGKTIKGLVSSGDKITRGLKSSGAVIQNVIPEISRGLGIIIKLPVGFGTQNTMRVFYNSMKNNLGKISKEVLNKDAAERLAQRLTKILADKKKTEVLNTIFQNARANETWGAMLSRYTGQGRDLIAGIIREGAENVAIDQTANYVSAAVVSVGGTIVTAGTTAVIVNSTDKK